MAHPYPIISPLQFREKVDEQGRPLHIADTPRGQYMVSHNGVDWSLHYPDTDYTPRSNNIDDLVRWASVDHAEHIGPQKIGRAILGRAGSDL